MSENVLRLENITMQFGGVVAVNDFSMHVDKGGIVALIGLCSSRPSAMLDLPGRRVYRRDDALTLTAPDRDPLPERELNPGEALPLPEAGLIALCRECAPGEEIQISFNTFSFSCANICGKLTVGCRKHGDSLTLSGRQGRRSVKKQLMEQRIPREPRGSVPVLRDEAGVLAVYGVGQREGSLPKAGEPFYTITFRKLTEEETE